MKRSATFLQLLEGLADERDATPGRDDVSALTHSLQTADRAIMADADDELILCALVHDAFRVLSPTHHGEALALALSDRLSINRQAILESHSIWQGDLVHGREQHLRYQRQPWYAEACRFAEWDAASFDPGYETPDLKRFRSWLEVLD